MDDECKPFTVVAPRRILVIKFSSLGDIVHTLPAVAALRTRFPSAHICWLVKSQWAEILEENPDIDEVVSVDLSWKHWLKLVRGLRQRQCDLVLDFQGLFRSGLLGLLSGATMRVGFAQAREGAPWMYTHRVSLPGDQEASWRLLRVHAIDRNLAIAQFLGADISQPILHFPEITEDRTYIRDLFQSAEVADHEDLIALAPWSRSALKSWPLSRFVELAEELVQRPTVRVVIIGGPSDVKKAEGFCRLESQGLINVVGKLSLRQLPELLRKMTCLIGNDSSLIHLAAGAGTPVLAIFGPTEPHATGPYPLATHVVRRTELECSPCGQRTCHNDIHLECLDTISVRSVVDALQELMVSQEG